MQHTSSTVTDLRSEAIASIGTRFTEMTKDGGRLTRSRHFIHKVTQWLTEAIPVDVGLVPASTRLDTAKQPIEITLPARRIALAYTIHGAADPESDTVLSSTTRIALLVDMVSATAVDFPPGSEQRSLGATRAPGAIMVVPIFRIDDTGDWEIAIGAAIIPKRCAASASVLSRFMAGRRTESDAREVVYLPILQEFAESYANERLRLGAMAAAANDELAVAIRVLSALASGDIVLERGDLGATLVHTKNRQRDVGAADLFSPPRNRALLVL